MTISKLTRDLKAKPLPIMGVLFFFFATACGGEVWEDDSWEDDLPVVELGADLIQPLLTFANDQQRTTFERLDLGCGLRKNAAQNIVDHRDGPDGVPDTADDDLFDSSDELDAVSKVGPVTLSQLGSCARPYGYHIPRDMGCKPNPHPASAPSTESAPRPHINTLSRPATAHYSSPVPP